MQLETVWPQAGDCLTPSERIEAAIATTLGLYPFVARAEVFSPLRSERVVLVRRECIRAVKRAAPHLSLPALGRIFGRDHTTILYHLAEEGRRFKREQMRERRQDLGAPAE